MAQCRFGVSERGENLSPKYPAETTIPAVIGAGIPSPSPMPMEATPRVPTMVQEVPVATAQRLVTKKIVTKKILGLIIFKP